MSTHQSPPLRRSPASTSAAAPPPQVSPASSKKPPPAEPSVVRPPAQQAAALQTPAESSSSSSMEVSSSYSKDSMPSMSEAFVRQILGRWSDEDKSRLFQLIKQNLEQPNYDFSHPVSCAYSAWCYFTSELNTNRGIHYTVEEVLEMATAMKESITYGIVWDGVCQFALRGLFLVPKMPPLHCTTSRATSAASCRREQVASCSGNHPPLLTEEGEGDEPSHTRLMCDAAMVLAELVNKNKISVKQCVSCCRCS